MEGDPFFFFPTPGWRGSTTCVRVFVLPGGHFFSARMAGGHGLGQQYAPNGRAFFAEPEGGGGELPRPAAGGKRVDTCGFYPLVPLLGRQVRFTSQAENPASFLAKSPLSYFRKMCARAYSHD